MQPDQLPDRVSKMVAQLKEAERQIADLKSQNVLADVDRIVATSHDMWGVGYICPSRGRRCGQRPAVARAGDPEPGRSTRRRSSRGRRQLDKPSVVIVTTEGARDRGLKAGDLVRAASETLGGRGGGKDDIAQGGGTDGARAEDALKAVEYAIGRTLQS